MSGALVSLKKRKKNIVKRKYIFQRVSQSNFSKKIKHWQSSAYSSKTNEKKNYLVSDKNQHKGIIYCNDNDKANILNQYFIEQTVIEEKNATLPTTLPLPAHKFDSITVTPDDVESTLKTLKLGKAAGPDAINNRILKELADSLSLPLSDIFNYSLSSGKLPSVWKLANVTPIHKKDDPSDVSNYRPISLLSTIGKVLEKNSA